MKVLVIFAVVLAVALAEPCRDNRDCAQHGVTTCSSSYHVVCHNHQCECTSGPTGTMCKLQSDCSGCDSGRSAHCIDGHCHCTRF